MEGRSSCRSSSVTTPSGEIVAAESASVAVVPLPVVPVLPVPVVPVVVGPVAVCAGMSDVVPVPAAGASGPSGAGVSAPAALSSSGKTSKGITFPAASRAPRSASIAAARRCTESHGCGGSPSRLPMVYQVSVSR
ncbi:hypothetical protein CJ468_05320 [Nocardia farcinica]|nr:hypothetical protein CJ468_05320 [Nocardia farcinica]